MVEQVTAFVAHIPAELPPSIFYRAVSRATNYVRVFHVGCIYTAHFYGRQAGTAAATSSNLNSALSPADVIVSSSVCSSVYRAAQLCFAFFFFFFLLFCFVKKNGGSKRRKEEWQLGIKLVTALLGPPAGSWLL